MDERSDQGRGEEGLVLLGPAPDEGGHRAYADEEGYYLVARRDGALVCIDDWCNHAGCLLSEGTIDEDAVTCPCHGARFRLGDGTIVSEPVICQSQDVHRVVELGGRVYRVRRTDET